MDLEKGREVFYSYGQDLKEIPNSELLEYYGFTLENQSSKTLKIKIKIPKESKMYSKIQEDNLELNTDLVETDNFYWVISLLRCLVADLEYDIKGSYFHTPISKENEIEGEKQEAEPLSDLSYLSEESSSHDEIKYLQRYEYTPKDLQKFEDEIPIIKLLYNCSPNDKQKIVQGIKLINKRKNVVGITYGNIYDADEVSTTISDVTFSSSNLNAIVTAGS